MAEEKVDNHKTGFTEEELAGLSEAERAALEEKDDDTEALRTIAGEGDDDDDDADAKAVAERKAAEEKAAADAKAKKEAEDKQAEEERKEREAELAKMSAEDRKKAEAEDKAAANAAAKEKAEADAKAKDEADAKAKADADARARADADVDEPLISTYRAEPPENYDAQVKALNERKAAATAKFKANEIEVEEMLAAHNEIDADRKKLDEQKLKAEISAEQQEQASQQRWLWEVNRFMRNVQKHEGVDYKGSNILNAALDAEVKRLANDEANKDKSGDWFLEQAHESVKKALGITGKKPAGEDKGAAAAAEAEAEAKKKAAEAERRKQADANRDKLHRGLGGLPAAGGGGGEPGGEGEFAHLDGLGGMELEYAVAKLTPEQQDRYARTS